MRFHLFHSNPANAGRFGTAGPYELQGPTIENLDLGLMKDFHFTETRLLRFEVMASDALNHPHFGLPASNISSPNTVGRITGTIGGNYVRGSADEREINLMLRLEF